MNRFIVFIVTTVLTLLAFGGALFHGFAPIDDAFLVVNNLAIRGITVDNLTTIFTTFDPELYIPLTLFSFQIDYLISGLSPFTFHLTNIILHIANALLVMLLLEKLSGKKMLAVLLGLFFALHPLNTEAVVWIAGRKDLLSTFFFLLALLSYLDFRPSTFRQAQDKLKLRMTNLATRGYVLSITFFLLALLSKVNTVTFIGVVFLLDWLVEKRSLERQMITEKIPFLVLGVLFMGVALFGKERIVSDASMVETIALSGKTSLFYLQKMILPTGLSVFHPIDGSVEVLSVGILLPFLIAVGLLIWSLRSRGTVALGFLLYLVMLSPTLLNAKKGAVTFFAVERYAYLPMIGVLIAAALLLRAIEIRRPLIIGSSIVLILFTLLSIKQTQVWETPRSVFAHALDVYPYSLSARVDLARQLREEAQYQEAFDLLREGREYEWQEPYLRLHSGYIYARTGQVREAREQFVSASRMLPENPEPVFALGSLEEQTGRRERARVLYEEAVALDPSYVTARIKLGKIYMTTGKTEEAREQFTQALQWNPSSVEARDLLEMLKG